MSASTPIASVDRSQSIEKEPDLQASESDEPASKEAVDEAVAQTEQSRLALSEDSDSDCWSDAEETEAPPKDDDCGRKTYSSRAAAAAAAAADPLLQAFDNGGRSHLNAFSKADFDRALGAHLPALLGLLDPNTGNAQLRRKMAALLLSSPACVLPYEFVQLFTIGERRRFCDLRATVCLDYYLERFASAFRDLPRTLSLGECGMCECDGVLLRERVCCGLPVCAICLREWVRVSMESGRPHVACPACPAAMKPDEVVMLGLEGRPNLRQRYDQLMVEFHRDPRVKTCPGCGHITQIPQPPTALPSTSASSQATAASESEVTCPSCGQTWCFACHGPRHPCRPCPDASDPDQRLLLAWSREMRPETDDEDASAVGASTTRRARHCPHCHALIERSGGCSHVTCAACLSEFCYLCGKPYWQKGSYLGGLLPRRLLGEHGSRLSVFGCSASLLPDRPQARRAVRRGLLAAGVGGAALVGLAAAPLLLVASPVWAPLLAVKQRQRRRRKKAEEAVVGNLPGDLL